jgi:hypothetical protein
MTQQQDWNPEMVYVINHNKNLGEDGKVFRDMCGGQPFAFPCDKRVKVLRKAANHFFGYDARCRLLDAQANLDRTSASQSELTTAREEWAKERARVLSRRGWNLKRSKTAEGHEVIEANPKADEILDNFEIEPVVEPNAADEAETAA